MRRFPRVDRFLKSCGSALKYLSTVFSRRKGPASEPDSGPTTVNVENFSVEARMTGLKTARVLIVDDNPEEIAPVMSALGQLGVGAVFCNGQPDQLPLERLYGVRLLFLDMDLGGGGESRQLIGQVMSVLQKVLPDDANPLMIVVWTKHKELFNEFKAEASQAFPHLRPGVVHMMGKADFGKDTKAITESIVKLLADNAPLDLVYLWEQFVHDAASYTVGSLSSIVGTDPQTWHRQMNALLGTLLQASAGNVLEPPGLVLACLFESLALVHLDQLTQLQQRLSSQLEPHAKPLIEAIRKASLSMEQKAALNRMLLIESPFASDQTVRPGNVYLVGEKTQFPGNVLKLEHKQVVEDLCEKDKDDALLQASKMLLVEVTPACDFAQGKQRQGRFVAGLLVKSSDKKLLKYKAQYVWASEAVELAEPRGAWMVVVDAHFLFGFDPKIVDWPPDFRFRAQAVVALQAWFAGQAARPGYVYVS